MLSRVRVEFERLLANRVNIGFEHDAESHERLLNGVELDNQKAAGRVLLVPAHCGPTKAPPHNPYLLAGIAL